MGHDGAGLRGVFEKRDMLNPLYQKIPAAGLLVLWQAESGSPFVLRQNYPEYWAMLLAWDKESPRTFKPNCTVEDLEQRFFPGKIGR